MAHPQAAETRRGRAELRLATITALWRDSPEPRRLPSLSEWVKIVCFTQHRAWSKDERRLMQAATRHILLRAGRGWPSRSRSWADAAISVRDRDRAHAALASALKADYRKLPGLLPQIAAHIGLLRPTLERLANDPRAPRTTARSPRSLLYRDRSDAGARGVPSASGWPRPSPTR